MNVNSILRGLVIYYRVEVQFFRKEGKEREKEKEGEREEEGERGSSVLQCAERERLIFMCKTFQRLISIYTLAESEQTFTAQPKNVEYEYIH